MLAHAIVRSVLSYVQIDVCVCVDVYVNSRQLPAAITVNRHTFASYMNSTKTYPLTVQMSQANKAKSVRTKKVREMKN